MTVGKYSCDVAKLNKLPTLFVTALQHLCYVFFKNL